MRTKTIPMTKLRTILALLIPLGMLAQGASVMPWVRNQFTDSAGRVLAAGTLEVDLAGTSTKATFYTDFTASVASANPVTLDSQGQAPIFLKPGAYKFVLKSSLGVVVQTIDNIITPNTFQTGTAPPVSGTYSQGQFILNSTPVTTPGSTSAVLGWLCVASGTPGTWVAVGPPLANHIPNSVTIDQNLTITGNLIANGLATSFPPDPAQYLFREDFEMPQTTAGTTSVGTYGWVKTNIGNGGLGSNPADTAGTFSHPGVIQFIANSVAQGDGVSYLPQSGTTLVGPIGNNASWVAYIIFQLAQTTNTDIRIGFSDGTALAPSNGIFLRYLSSSDTNFVFENRSAGTPTTSTTNSVAADTAWHCVKIAGTSTPGTIGFQIGATCTALGTQTLVAGASTSASLSPYFVIASDGAAAAKGLFMDLFLYQATGIR